MKQENGLTRLAAMVARHHLSRIPAKTKYSSTPTLRLMALALLRGDLRGYLGLRSSDPSFLLPDGVRFHPTRGTEGSVFVTQDHTPYVRTRFGNRRLHPMVGNYVLDQQRRQRKKLAWQRGLITVALLALPFLGAALK